jgi:hypothetical protein
VIATRNLKGRHGIVVAVAVLAAGSAACTSDSTPHAKNVTSYSPAPPVHPPTGRCAEGAYRLTITPATVRPGQLATFSDTAPRSPNMASLGSWGRLGSVRSGEFVLLWNLAVIVSGQPRTPNVPAGSSIAEAGTGLLNRPSQFQAPDVAPGSYQVQVDLSVHSPNAVSRSSTLCAPLRIG